MSFRNAKGGYIRPGYDPLEVANPPTGAGASAGNQSASVSFTAPTNTGGSAITNYYAVSNPGQITASSVTSPISVSGLTNGTEYTFKVWGENSYGPSAYSAPTGAVTPSPPYIEDVFSTYLYTGNGSTQTITNGIDLAGEGGLVWIKSRSASSNHAWFDSARGSANVISSSLTDGQNAFGSITGATFLSDGFSFSTNDYGWTNTSGATYASWTFRKTEKFFDVVTYTGNGVAGRAISHNLGSAPGCIIFKNLTQSTNWGVYHRSIANTKSLYLNLTDAETTSSAFNNSTATSTEFYVGTSVNTNNNGDSYVAYLFAHDAGGFGDDGDQNVISCGSTDGVSTVNLGYEPQWVLVKASSSTGGWYLIDNMRGWTVAGGDQQWLFANSSSAEGTYTNYGGLNSTGFSLNISSGVTYIYIAIRRGPMKTPTTGTSVFMPFATGSSGGPPAYISGFVTDLVMTKDRGSVGNNYIQSRLTGTGFMLTNLTNSEATDSLNKWDYMNGWYNGVGTVTYENWWGALFRRAPGFFDVVCYTGTGSATTISHNLGVAPELMIVKSRSLSVNSDWAVYNAASGNTGYTYLNDSLQVFNSGVFWNSTTPTASVFSIGTNSRVNSSGETYVAYLFATCPGVSKVGSYTGNGSSQTINCGFTGGARFVLIKRTDSTGDWYVWDSARGIVAGNDPYLLLNSTAAEVTNTDYVDTYSAGFEISSTAPAAINANGGTFIFLAIA